MRSLVWTAPSKMEIQEKPKPELKSGWVLLEVAKSGICGSEISAFLGHNELRRPPLVMGHEFSGTVVDVGPDVESDWKGALATVNPLLSCNQCRQCRRGLRQLCASRKIVGVDFPGSYAQYVAVPASSLYRVKDNVAGSLIEPLACGVRAAELAGVEVGDSAMVIGAGTIGLMVAKVLKSKGARQVVVSDTNPARLKWAHAWGASSVFNPRSADTGSMVRENTSGEGFDSVVDAVGSVDTRTTAVASIRRGGRAVFIGLHEGGAAFPGNDLVRSEKQVIGSFCYSDDDFRRSVGLANGGFLETTGGWIDVRPLASGEASFLEQTTPTAPFSKILLDSQA